MEAIEVLVERSAERVRLCSPGVGTLTELRRPGSLVAPGEQVGVLVTLGRARSLCAPADVAGRVVSPLRDRVHAPVGYGELVCELAPLRSAELEPAGASEPERGAHGLVLRAPQTGRFWRRGSPKDAPLAIEGDALSAGTALGLIEVMKTFTHITYQPGRGLPSSARIKAFLVADGGDVEEGAALVELDPA